MLAGANGIFPDLVHQAVGSMLCEWYPEAFVLGANFGLDGFVLTS